MPGEGSEKKKIAELYFDYKEAEKGLESIDKKLQELSKNSQTVFSNIQRGMENSFNTKNSKINVSGITKDLNKLNEYQIKQTIKLNTKQREEELKTAAYKERLQAQTTSKGYQYEMKRADNAALIDKQIERNSLRHTEKMEEIYARQAKSSETMYGKIAEYAKTYLIYQGFNILKNEAKELTDEMIKVQYQMVQIDRVLNESSLDVNKYRDQLMQLAYDYGNSFENVADITLRLAQAGLDSEQALSLTEKTLLALNTAELDATQATSDMIAVMSQWNLLTGDATKVSEEYGEIIDKINRVADNFPITSADIMDALKKTSSAFNIAGASIDETIASIVAAEKASQRGGKAIGTALNSIIQQLKTEGRLATMEGLGIDLYTDDTKTQFKSVMEIFEQLSSKMQELKSQGKETSVEMQNLMTVFTVMRRNIGSSLLGEMGGESSTYQQVLDMVKDYDTIGYSLQENEKHMKTAKAALEQFNTTLLQLKTSIWDNGLEDVFRGMLLLGTDVANVIKKLIDTFGALPVAIGAATLAFSTFQKKIKFESLDGKIGLGGDFIKKIKDAQKEVMRFQNIMNGAEVTNLQFSDSFKKYVNSVGTAEISTKGYIQTLIALEATEIATKLATMALNAALSIGLSLAITAVISLVDKLVHAKENHIKKIKEEIQATQENIDNYKEEKENVDNLISEYEKLNAVSENERTTEQAEELKKIQSEITETLRKNGEQIDSNNTSYEEQVKKLKEISENELPRVISEYEVLLGKQKELNKPALLSDLNFFKQTNVRMDLNKAGITDVDFYDLFYDKKGFHKEAEEQIKILTEWQQKLREAKEEGVNVNSTYEWVTKTLAELNENNKNVLETQSELNELYADEAAQEYFDNLISEKSINSLQDYKDLLNEIYQTSIMPEEWQGSIEEFRDELNSLAEQEFPELVAQIQEFSNAASKANSDYKDQITTLENVSNNYTTLTTAMQQYNKSGEITIDTFNKLVNNDLLQYLDLVNGKLVIQENDFINAANTAKSKAASDLQEQAAAQILSIAINDLNINLEGSEEAGIKSARGSKTAAQAALEAAKAALEGATSFDAFNKAMKGDAINLSGLSENAKKQIDSVISDVNKKVAALNKVTLSAAKSASGGASKAAKSAGGAAKKATKTFEEQSAERVKTFKKEIDDFEKLEQSWVNKYKKLEMFSTSDLKFITHQRINRYNEYLNQISQLQGISEQDRTELTREYSAKRQEAELEYFDLLKDQLNEQIKNFEEANKKRIQQIKDEAQAKIDALKKVDEENDKIKQKEEYERKRQELIYGNQGIEYWKQRTGREAQIALAKAQQELEDLDRDWEEKKQEWTLDDQIKEIEKARDAQVTAIEEAQEKQIEGWKAAYKAQVELYAQTGQIIYDDSVINAGYLYNAYMDNFVTPFHAQIQSVVNSINQASIAADEVINKMNTISGGGGGGGSVQQAVSGEVYGPFKNTPISPLLNAKVKSTNSYNVPQQVITAPKNNLKGGTLWDKVKTGVSSAIKRLIGKFHGGGEVGSQTEALALLRPKEVVLTPEWAAGMNKLVKSINDGSFKGNGGTTNNIDIQGNLVNLEANIKNKQDADYMTEKIEKVLKDKFNIRK